MQLDPAIAERLDDEDYPIQDAVNFLQAQIDSGMLEGINEGAVCVLRDALFVREEHIKDLEAERLRFYRADGTFEVLASAEEVTKRRVACAARLAELEEVCEMRKSAAILYKESAEGFRDERDRFHAEVENLLDSASPHPTEHPTMHRAWVQATATLAEFGHPFLPTYLK